MSQGATLIVQISDLHLPVPPQTHYRQIDAAAQLAAVLGDIAARFPDAARLLVSGDNVHQGDEQAYRALAAQLDGSGLCWEWLPGNHDDAAAMARVRPLTLAPPLGGAWQCLLLDSTAEPDGRGGGCLSEAALAALALAARDPRPALLVLHHNPMAVGSAWQDAIGLKQAERFWALAARLDPRSLVLCGHLHQVWDRRDTPLRVLSCPSTAVQFRAGCEHLELEREGEQALPGYRWLRLAPAGGVTTGIRRVRLA